MDRAFGRLRGALTELGIRDNTLLWYCSDNGALPKVGNAGGFRGHKGQIYEGGLLVPAILEWPAKIPEPRTTSIRTNTSDMFPTLLEVAGVTVPDRPPLDGLSLVPLIEGRAPDARGEAMGFWNHVAPGIRTPSAEWMAELLAAQEAGNDLPADRSSLDAAKLPDPPHPADAFPGHAAWIDGDWKLHRIENQKTGRVTWELYDLAADPEEGEDLADAEPGRVAGYRPALETWLASVVRSLNGEDY